MAFPDNPVVLAIGFEMKLYSRADVSAWVDERVARVDVVAGPLLELTTLREKDDGVIATTLCAMAGPLDNAEMGRIALAALYCLLATKQLSLSAAAKCFRSFRFKYFSEEDAEYVECLVLDDAYDLAADGTYGTLADVERDMLAFLEPYAAPLDKHEG